MLYDASKKPDPQTWLELDESERIDLVIDYHRRNHLPFGKSAKLHGAAHVMVENATTFSGPLAKAQREWLHVTRDG
jgi:hypothetical protein